MNPEKIFDFYDKDLDPKKSSKDGSEDIIEDEIQEKIDSEEKIIRAEDDYFKLSEFPDNHGTKYPDRISMIQDNIKKEQERIREEERTIRENIDNQ